MILSAGSIGTPQIMLLSGIGNAKELKKLGINALVDSPEVGMNLQDHALLPNQFSVNGTQTWEAARDKSVAQAQMTEYTTNGTGPLVDSMTNHIAWLQVPKSSPIWANATDVISGPTSSHYELVIAVRFTTIIITISISFVKF